MDNRRLQELIEKVDRYYSSLTPDQLAEQVEATQRVYDKFFGSLPYEKVWSTATTVQPYKATSDFIMMLTYKNGETMFVTEGAEIVERFEIPYSVKQPDRDRMVVTFGEGVVAS
jgi:hypothetical protein